MARRHASALALLLALAGPACSPGSQAGTAYSLIPGKSRVDAPSLAGSGPEPPEVDLPILRGRVVVLDLDVPGTVAGQAQYAVLATVAQRLTDDGVVLLRVLETPEALQSKSFVVQGHLISYPSKDALDQTRQAIRLAISGFPTAIVVDRRGRIAARIIGVVDASRLLATMAQVSAES